MYIELLLCTQSIVIDKGVLPLDVGLYKHNRFSPGEVSYFIALLVYLILVGFTNSLSAKINLKKLLQGKIEKQRQ